MVTITCFIFRSVRAPLKAFPAPSKALSAAFDALPSPTHPLRSPPSCLRPSELPLQPSHLSFWLYQLFQRPTVVPSRSLFPSERNPASLPAFSEAFPSQRSSALSFEALPGPCSRHHHISCSPSPLRSQGPSPKPPSP